MAFTAGHTERFFLHVTSEIFQSGRQKTFERSKHDVQRKEGSSGSREISRYLALPPKRPFLLSLENKTFVVVSREKMLQDYSSKFFPSLQLKTSSNSVFLSRPTPHEMV